MTKNKILTPFYYLAGTKTLLIGILFLFITAILSYYSYCRFNGLIDIHFVKPIHFPFVRFLMDQFIGWLLICVFFCLGFLCTGAGRWPRWVDIFGTTLFARIPLVIAPLLTCLLQYFISNNATLVLLMLEFICIISVVFYIVLLFNAYKVCFNLNETKLKLSFTLLVIIGELLISIPNIRHLLY